MHYFFLALAIFCSALAQAKVYQWVDESGRTHFSDKPPAALLEKKPPPPVPSSIKSNTNTVLNSALAHKKEKASTKQPLILQIRQLLEEQKYSKLNAILEAARATALTDLSKEADLVTLYRAFNINSKQYAEKFNSWVNAYPASYQPFLARAKYFQTMGWMARGHKWGSETSDEQRTEMNTYFSKAQEDIQKALRRNPKSIVAYLIWIDISNATADLAESEIILRDGLKVSPASYEIRRSYIRRLRPRWGGSIEKMVEFSAESLQVVDKNPQLLSLPAWILEDIASSLVRNKNYTLAISTLDEGFLKLKNAASSEGYYQIEFDPYLINMQGYTHYRSENYAEALKYLNIAISQNENIDDFYYHRSKVNSALKNYLTSANDHLIALSINPYSEKYISHKNYLVARLTYQAYEARKNLRYPKALQLLNMALTLDPYKDSTLRSRAYLYIKKNQIKQAKQDVDRAIELMPLEYDNYKAMDDVLLQQRRFKEITQYWDKYIELQPKDSRAFFERSGTYYHLKRLDLAMKDAKIAAALGHPNAEALYQSYQPQWSSGK